MCEYDARTQHIECDKLVTIDIRFCIYYIKYINKQQDNMDTSKGQVVDVRWYCEKPADLPTDVKYVGRPTIFGNPFHKSLTMSHDEVVEKHRVYLERRLKRDKYFERKMMELAGYNLACWCKSKHPELSCHADNILHEINKRLQCE